MRALGLGATEAGPPGFLPADPSAARTALQQHALGLVGGFVTAVLHEPKVRAAELAGVERQASWLADLGHRRRARHLRLRARARRAAWHRARCRRASGSR